MAHLLSLANRSMVKIEGELSVTDLTQQLRNNKTFAVQIGTKIFPKGQVFSLVNEQSAQTNTSNIVIEVNGIQTFLTVANPAAFLADLTTQLNSFAYINVENKMLFERGVLSYVEQIEPKSTEVV